jgi:hypothetical protein
MAQQDLKSTFLSSVSVYLDASHPPMRLRGLFLSECLMKIMDPESSVSFELPSDAQEISFLKTLTGFKPEAELKDINTEDPTMNALIDSDDEEVIVMADGKSFDITEKSPAPPRYLKECISYLNETEDAQKIELGLQFSTLLIEKASETEINEQSLSLCQVLVFLPNSYDFEHFELHMTQAMVHLLGRASNRIIPYLVDTFYEGQLSLGQRMDILRWISQTAWKKAFPEEETFVEKDAIQTLLSQKLESQTRRWGSGKVTVKSVKNAFGPLYERYFYPLIRRFELPKNKFKLDSNLIVLEQFIRTVSVIVYCSSKFVKN